MNIEFCPRLRKFKHTRFGQSNVYWVSNPTPVYGGNDQCRLNGKLPNLEERMESKAFVLFLATWLILAAGCITPPAAPDPTAAGQGATPLLPNEPPPFSTAGWKTDFTKRTVAWDEVLSGGPPKDGIPAINQPTFESVATARERLAEQSPVLFFAHGSVTRAYPLDILIWHEIVNDVVDGQPVAVTFCPLCNASIVFDRQVGEQTLDFGTTGKLRKSDLIMYDRQTESWWQQALGEAIAGEFTGTRLTFLASQVMSFGDFATEFPDGEVLAIPTEFSRSYGQNPYIGYDSTAQPFLYDGELDVRLPATERVVGIQLGAVARAYPFTTLTKHGVVNDELAETPIAIFFKGGVSSALDTARIDQGRDVGSTVVFDRRLDNQVLTFAAAESGTFTDAETGSTWNIVGEAMDGPLVGQQLTRVVAFDHFWFAWRAFFPETELFASPE
jgi:hypothetical protein